MYAIDRDKKTLSPLESRSFSEMDLGERFDLQEWLDKTPDALGEELLIIQKEFAEFKDTKERLDLLALDKNGSLVIIENKRDDSGKDVVWQALRYVAYCSSLKKSQVVEIFGNYRGMTEEDTSEAICEFLEVDSIEEAVINSGTSQRFILVAAKFRKEVTSTILWLLANGIQAQCMKTSLLTHGDDLFLDIQQIIPTPEAEDYMISMSSKDSEEKETKAVAGKSKQIYYRFWEKALIHFREQNIDLYRNSKPASDAWLFGHTGVANCSYLCCKNKRDTRVAFYICGRKKGNNEKIFNFLHDRKQDIETRFGTTLEWERTRGGNYFIYFSKAIEDHQEHDEENWQNLIEWLGEHFRKLEEAFRPEIEGLQQKFN